MWYDGYNSSRRRGQTAFIIPAWRKGDRVLHKPSGIYGELVMPETAAGELWKFKADGHERRCWTVHACDLELRT